MDDNKVRLRRYDDDLFGASQVHIELKCTINNVTTAHLTGSTNGLLVSLWLGIFVTGENSPEPELHSHAEL